MLNIVFLCLFNCIAPPQADTGKVIVGSIAYKGNERTKSTIIRRELLIHEGDTLSTADFKQKLERSRLNLLNTRLFNFVTVDLSPSPDSLRTQVVFNLSEAWYTWPMPILELVDRNPNEWLRRMDLTRTNYGLYITQYNVRGRNETLNLGFRGGYTQSFDITYTIPYINRSQRAGLSAGYGYSRNHETAVSTRFNKLRFYSDPDRFSRHQFNITAAYTYRRSFFVTHVLRGGYRSLTVEDTVLKLNPRFLPVNNTNLSYPYVSYFFRKDVRDLKAYPLRGYYLDLEVLKAGIGSSGSIDEWFITANAKKFWNLRGPFYYAAALTGKAALVERQSYFNQVALGYDDQLRGYEYYVINGQYYGFFQSNFKYNLLKTKIVTLRFIPLEKFRTIPNTIFLNLFADAGYVRDAVFAAESPLANSLLYSYGLGMDYVTYYNGIFRVDYSMNKFGENGIFIHFTIPI